MKNYEECKYYLPCGWCDRLDRPCKEAEQSQPTVKENKKEFCVHEWEMITPINTLTSSYWRCKKCGETKTENYQEYEQKIPYINLPYIQPTDATDPCERCPNNPKNGGSGICHCILGNRNQVTCTSGYINTNELEEVESTLTTNVTTSASTDCKIKK